MAFGPQQSSALEQLGRRWRSVQREVFLLLLDLSDRHLLTVAVGREGTLSGAGGEGGRNVPLCGRGLGAAVRVVLLLVIAGGRRVTAQTVFTPCQIVAQG